MHDNRFVSTNTDSESPKNTQQESDDRLRAGEKERAHRQALERNLSDYFTSGESIEVFIQTPAEKNGGEEAVAVYSRGEVQDARVFVDPGTHHLHRGCRVRCRIRYCGDSFLKALALYRLD
jgi:hypothetical protein